MKMKELICDACHKPIEKGQYAYEIQLDNRTIKKSHGYPCCDSFEIKRVPIHFPDWWIRQIPNPADKE
jgi:RNase P subunit RPR2